MNEFVAENQREGKPPSVSLWMPLFIEEHRARASTLSHTEHSALCYLTMLLWEFGGDIPDDDKWIARKLRLSVVAWKAMRNVVLEGCTVTDGRIYHAKLAAELDKAKANVEQKRKAGRASAAARKVNGCSTAVATAVQPRAGSGSGSGLYHGSSYLLEGVAFEATEGGDT